MVEHEILNILFARDENGITVLEREYGKLCYSIASNILGNDADADECVNDTLLAVWNTIPPNQPVSLSSYICRITKNLALSRLREQKAQKRQSNYALALEELETTFVTSETPETTYHATELAEAIQKWLDRQTDFNRALFIRRYWYAEAVSSLAKQFHLTENQTSVRLYRLREKLKKQLLKEGFL